MSKVYVIANICQNKKKIDKKIETNNYPPPKKHKQTNEQKRNKKHPKKENKTVKI